MKLNGRLIGSGTLLLSDRRWKGVPYDIEVWEADTGLKSARGALSVTVVAGPCKLILEDGRHVDLFVTTTGERGSSFLVKGTVPELG
jgi:hypothetical protein